METTDSDLETGLWRRSPSPLEDWGDVEGSWEVSVIGEHVDYRGNVRHEVQWKGWQRKDGTNQTYKDEYIDPEDSGILTDWDRAQKKRRLKAAQESVEVEMNHHLRLDFHNNNTLRRSQALEEKLKQRQTFAHSWVEDLVANTASRERAAAYGAQAEAGPSSGRSLRETPARQKERGASIRPRASAASSLSHPEVPSSSVSTRTVPSSSASQSSTRTSALTSTVSSSRTRLASTPATEHMDDLPLDSLTCMSEKARGKQRAIDPPPTPPPRKRRKKDRRQALSDEWTSMSGFQITFANDVDDQDIPDLSPNFKYLEATYQFGKGVVNPGRDFLFGCECQGRCSSAHLCHCQAESQVEDSLGNRAYAYNKKGFFRLDIVTGGAEVIECNENCSCDETCQNRVVQRQRDFPVEVFKTRNCGWGVRSSVNLPKGKVLGLCTGLLIRRNKSKTAAFCFDLDGHEVLEESQAEEQEQSYTVNSLEHGNWTRFINHSCAPNLRTFLVSHDTPPNTGMYYIGFAAAKDIPAGQELVFDYSPRTGTGTGKGRVKCLCEAKKCRGFVC